MANHWCEAAPESAAHTRDTFAFVDASTRMTATRCLSSVHIMMSCGNL